jgi:hypothetical protein
VSGCWVVAFEVFLSCFFDRFFLVLGLPFGFSSFAVLGFASWLLFLTLAFGFGFVDFVSFPPRASAWRQAGIPPSAPTPLHELTDSRPARSPAHSVEQFARREAEGAGELDERVDAGSPFAALKLADRCAVE